MRRNGDGRLTEDAILAAAGSLTAFGSRH